nr:regulatory protein RecX [Microbacterium halimionae]
MFRDRSSDASVAKSHESRERPAQRNVSGALSKSRGQSNRSSSDRHPNDPAPEATSATAESALLRKLRARSLSIREARAVIGAHISDADAQQELIDSFLERGYLDDAALAEQLIYSGTERKGQGRRAIAQTMMQRGISRDVSDAALAALPDDDDDRALDFARSKARSLRSVERQAALRRLAGQLGRRGFPGNVALSAARQALDELE